MLKLIISSNSLEIEMPKVQVVWDSNILLFYNFDDTFYISSQCLKLAKNEPSKLALLICHELSHYLLDHQAKRVFTMWARHKLNGFSSIFKLKSQRLRVSPNPAVAEFDKRVYPSQFGCFYNH